MNEPRPEPMALHDFSKLKIAEGVIHYSIYQQDGSLQPMTCQDTLSNRYFVSWVQKFDRYTVHGKETERPEQ